MKKFIVALSLFFPFFVQNVEAKPQRVCIFADGSIKVKRRCNANKNQVELDFSNLSGALAGDQGPQGEQGPEGPQGPAGPAGADGAAGDPLIGSDVACDPGQYVVSILTTGEVICDVQRQPRCFEPQKVIGPCDGIFLRYSYNETTGNCEQFIYGGCGGNENNFTSLADCRAACGA